MNWSDAGYVIFTNAEWLSKIFSIKCFIHQIFYREAYMIGILLQILESKKIAQEEKKSAWVNQLNGLANHFTGCLQTSTFPVGSTLNTIKQFQNFVLRNSRDLDTFPLDLQTKIYSIFVHMAYIPFIFQKLAGVQGISFLDSNSRNFDIMPLTTLNRVSQKLIIAGRLRGAYNHHDEQKMDAITRLSNSHFAPHQYEKYSWFVDFTVMSWTLPVCSRGLVMLRALLPLGAAPTPYHALNAFILQYINLLPKEIAARWGIVLRDIQIRKKAYLLGPMAENIFAMGRECKEPMLIECRPIKDLPVITSLGGPDIVFGCQYLGDEKGLDFFDPHRGSFQFHQSQDLAAHLSNYAGQFGNYSLLSIGKGNQSSRRQINYFSAMRSLLNLAVCMMFIGILLVNEPPLMAAVAYSLLTIFSEDIVDVLVSSLLTIGDATGYSPSGLVKRNMDYLLDEFKVGASWQQQPAQFPVVSRSDIKAAPRLGVAETASTRNMQIKYYLSGVANQAVSFIPTYILFCVLKNMRLKTIIIPVLDHLVSALTYPHVQRIIRVLFRDYYPIIPGIVRRGEGELKAAASSNTVAGQYAVDQFGRFRFLETTRSGNESVRTDAKFTN